MPTYRLQTLLELRERTEKEKKDQLTEAKKKLRQEQQKAEDLRKEHQAMKDNRKAKEDELFAKMQSGELGVKDYNMGERYLKRLDREIEEFINVIKEQDKKVAFAEQEVEWCQEELIKASQELQALEKHKEKWLAEYKKEMAAKEEMAQEEIATTLFLFGRK
jgi:flagellar export protein FliJ